MIHVCCYFSKWADTCVHSSFIHNSQTVEANWRPSVGEQTQWIRTRSIRPSTRLESLKCICLLSKKKKNLEKIHTLISTEKNPWKCKITGVVKWAVAVNAIAVATRDWCEVESRDWRDSEGSELLCTVLLSPKKEKKQAISSDLIHLSKLRNEHTVWT